MIDVSTTEPQEPAHEVDATQGPGGAAALASADRPQITHVADEQRDGALHSISRVAQMAAARQLPIRMRVNIQLWDLEDQQYVAWRSQVWKVEAKDQSEAETMRDALEGFWDLMAIRGADATGQVLRDLVRAAQE